MTKTKGSERGSQQSRTFPSPLSTATDTLPTPPPHTHSTLEGLPVQQSTHYIIPLNLFYWFTCISEETLPQEHSRNSGWELSGLVQVIYLHTLIIYF